MAPIVQDFEANFTQFQTAVRDADAQLKSFSTDSDRIAAQLGRMTDQFSGVKVIQQATMMAEAIERVGGVSTLTATELQKVGTVAADALAKARALGVDAPAGVQALATASAEARGEMGLLGDTIGEVGTKLAQIFAVEKLIEFGKQVIENGAQIEKMGQQTGMAADEVQRLQYIAGQTDTSVEGLVSAAQNLAVRLGKGDEGAARALDDMHISMDSFLSMDPYQQLVAISKGYDELQGSGKQAVDMQALFGKTWKEIMPAVKADMDELGNHAVTMSEHTVEGLANLSHFGSAMWDALKAKAGDIIVAVDDAGMAMMRFESTGYAHLQHVAEAADHVAQSMRDVNGAVEAFEDALRKSADKAWNEDLKEQAENAKKVAEELKKFSAAVAEANSTGDGWRGTLQQMDGATVEWGKHLIASGMSLSALATYYGLTATQATAMKKSLEDDTAQLKLQQDAIKLTSDIWNDYFRQRAVHGATATDQAIADIHRWEQAQIIAAQHAHTDTVSFYGALAADVAEKLRGLSVDWSAINNTMTTDTKAGLQQIADKARATFEEAKTHVGEFSNETIQRFRDQADAAQRAADNFGTAYATNADKATEAIKKTGAAVDDVAKKTKDAAQMVQSFAGNMLPSSDSLSKAAMVPGSLLGFGTGPSVASGGDNAAAAYAWIQRLVGRAAGGSVSAGSPYLVGEAGPELFVPSSSGSIVPGGGGPVINNTFHLVDTASNLARQVSDTIARQITTARRL